MFHRMSTNAATIRELRTDFRSVKRKIEQHGEVTITDHGQPSYVLKSLPPPIKMKASARDYYARLLKRQPKALSPKETRQFWEEERH
jgi:antitoxin (DNA-binding transcriptional repressor) of toxin-antitoxin stability system